MGTRVIDDYALFYGRAGLSERGFASPTVAEIPQAYFSPVFFAAANLAFSSLLSRLRRFVCAFALASETGLFPFFVPAFAAF